MESKDLQKKGTEEYEASIKKHLEFKLNLLDTEEAIKKKADFTAIEPQYAYENSDEWKEYMREVAMHNIFQNRIAITKQQNDLEVKRLEREESENSIKEGY